MARRSPGTEQRHAGRASTPDGGPGVCSNMLRYHILLFKMNRLAGRNKLSGVEEISLSGQLAEMVDSASTAARVIADLFDHANPQVRRIALNAIRRSRQFSSPELQPAL